jgi:uncharacterized protein YwqG
MNVEQSACTFHIASLSMAANDNLSALCEAELIQALVDNIQLRDSVEHIGRKNRLMDQQRRILAELEARDGSLQSLRHLLDHADPSVQLCAAFALKNVDRPTCKRILNDLAKRSDRAGWEARQCLEWGFRDQDGDAKERPRSKPSPCQRPRDTPPPQAMSLAEIGQLLADQFPADRAEQLLRLARPAIGLWPQRRHSALAATASRLGGMPHAPPGWLWPLCETEPMFFLGQVNCAELTGLAAADRLPSSGLLAFFGDHDAVMSGMRYGERPIAVYHWAEIDRLVPVAPPVELPIVFPACGIAFYPFIDLPDRFSRVVESVFPEQEHDWDFYDSWRAVRDRDLPEEAPSSCALGKLFGWPRLQQGDLRSIDDLNESDSFHLLLQIDSYSNGSESAEWGDHGSLYFLMRDDDLMARRFDRCQFDMQCG